MKSMRVTKCDLCKKNISGGPIVAGVGYLRNKEFCGKCGKPVLDFLKKHDFSVADPMDKIKSFIKREKSARLTP